MSTQEGGERDEELLRRYRQASEARPAAPSATTRAAILEHAREAAARYEQSPAQPAAAALAMKSTRRPRPRWQYALLGTASAAVLAGILVLPRFMQHPEQIAQVPAVAPPTASGEAAPAAPSPALKDKSVAEERAGARRREAPVAESYRSNQAAPPSLAKSEAPAAPASSGALAPAEAARDLQAARSSPAPARANAAPAGAAPSREDRKRDAAQRLAEVAMSGDAAIAPLLDAVQAADLPRLRELIARGAALEVTDTQGRTPLMLATLQGQTDAVAVLLKAGANPNAADRTGRTPLEMAQREGRTDIAALLLKAGAR